MIVIEEETGMIVIEEEKGTVMIKVDEGLEAVIAVIEEEMIDVADHGIDIMIDMIEMIEMIEIRMKEEENLMEDITVDMIAIKRHHHHQ
jgi:hypothetical protein